jgi:hypothetical protein
MLSCKFIAADGHFEQHIYELCLQIRGERGREKQKGVRIIQGQ